MAMEPVLVHGDVNEGQVVVDDTLSVTCVLDWERAHVGHPLKDFDFGEWGYGIFAWEPHSGVLRRRMWEAYVAERGGSLPSWRAMHLAFCLAWAHGYSRGQRLNDWAGPGWRTTWSSSARWRNDRSSRHGRASRSRRHAADNPC